jgi:hypothetical protein
MKDQSDTDSMLSLQRFLRQKMPTAAAVVGDCDFRLIVRLVVRYWPRRSVRRGIQRRECVEAVLIARVREEFEARRTFWIYDHGRLVRSVFGALVIRSSEDPLLHAALAACSAEMARHGVEPL